jgi:hypothetical protein
MLSVRRLYERQALMVPINTLRTASSRLDSVEKLALVLSLLALAVALWTLASSPVL